MTTYTKAPTAIETRWMPAVLAVLSETEGQTARAIWERAHTVDGGTRGLETSIKAALYRLRDAGLARREGAPFARTVRWFLTPRGAAQRTPAGGGAVTSETSL
jgi:hypothetical protein